MSFVIDRSDGTQRKVSGYKAAKPKLGVKRFGAGAPAQKALPPKVDLRPYLTPVEDQEETSSCVANAVAGAYEYLFKRHRGDAAYDVSRLFIYYNARTVNSEDDIEDGGSFISDAIEGLKQYGACSEETWPFELDNVNEEPDEDSYDEAAGFLIEDTAVVPTDLNAWKRAIAEGYPIIFGINLYESFDQHRKPGLVPMPSPKESSRESHGGHAMLCVGYSDPDQVFIVRNSWGSGWGDKGYCYIPYRYLLDAKYNDGDSWIIRRIEDAPIDEDSWEEDDESILTDLQGELASMDDETYGALLDAMGDFPLESRVALLFLHAAGADEDISEEELTEIATYLGEVLESLSISRSPEKVLRKAINKLDDEDLLEETISIFGEHLSNAALAGIVSKLEEVIGTDDLSEEEESFLDDLVEAWQIEGSDEEEEEEEDEEAEDDEEEEDEEEEEEEEEDEDDEEEYDEEEEEEDDTPKKRRR